MTANKYEDYGTLPSSSEEPTSTSSSTAGRFLQWQWNNSAATTLALVVFIILATIGLVSYDVVPQGPGPDSRTSSFPVLGYSSLCDGNKPDDCEIYDYSADNFWGGVCKDCPCYDPGPDATYCDGNGGCRPKRETGEACNQNWQCKNGTCKFGFLSDNGTCF